MNKGILCISIDTELMWGRKDLDHSKFVNKVKKEREVIKKLLRLFNKYNIPVTWAIVGKLYETGNSLWSGKDIISWIKDEKIHEIASHSYSHEDFSQISKTEAREELKKNKANSFVFPKNHINYLSLLKENNFKAYRGKDKSEFELLIPRIPPTGKVRLKNKLIEIPSSMYFVSARNIRKHIPFGLRFYKSKLGINRAISKKEIFHLWFHPIDFVDNSNSLFMELENILKYANQKRVKGLLTIKTMKQITYEKSLE